MKRIAGAAGLVLLIMLGMGQSIVLGQATATFTPSYTATLNNSGLIAIATIPPPRACWSALVPCGPMPFTLPRFPTVALASPTRWPTVPSPTPIENTATPTFTHTPTETHTPTFTYTPSNTPTGTITPATSTPADDAENIIDGIGSGFNVIAETLAAQATRVVYIDGTPQGGAELAEQLGQRVGVIFGVARTMQSQFSGPGGSVIAFLMLALGFVLSVYVLCFALPIILSFVRFVLQFIDTVKPFMIAVAFGLLALLGSSYPAAAQGPTATPTPIPYPTGEFSTLRAPPTMWSTLVVTPINLGMEQKAYDLADNTINGYRFLNMGGVVDWLIFIGLGFIIIKVLMSILNEFQGEA